VGPVMMWKCYVGSTSSQRRDRQYKCPLPIPCSLATLKYEEGINS
jgi:hypothetical protein